MNEDLIFQQDYFFVMWIGLTLQLCFDIIFNSYLRGMRKLMVVSTLLNTLVWCFGEGAMYMYKS